MQTLAYVALAILAIIIFVRVKAGFAKYSAAMNALLAKHTFDLLPAADQQRVIERAKQIITMGGATGDRLASLAAQEKFGFYALAMAELGIRPAIPGQEWTHVRNPFVALLRADSQIKAAQRGLERTHGVKIEL